jgi:hypothetical protein
MMAPVVRHRRTATPSASGRHRDRVGSIDGLESLDSGPHRLPVEPTCVLDPKGGDGAVSWDGCACEVDGVVSAGRAGSGDPRGARVDDPAGAGGAARGARHGGGGGGGPGGRDADVPGARHGDGGRDDAAVVQCPPAADDRRVAEEDRPPGCLLDRQGAPVRHVPAPRLRADGRDSGAAGTAEPAAGAARRLQPLAVSRADVPAGGGVRGGAGGAALRAPWRRGAP